MKIPWPKPESLVARGLCFPPHFLGWLELQQFFQVTFLSAGAVLWPPERPLHLEKKAGMGITRPEPSGASPRKASLSHEKPYTKPPFGQFARSPKFGNGPVWFSGAPKTLPACNGPTRTAREAAAGRQAHRAELEGSRVSRETTPMAMDDEWDLPTNIDFSSGFLLGLGWPCMIEKANLSVPYPRRGVV